MKKSPLFRLLPLLLALRLAAPYTMTLDGGKIAIRENASGEWLYRSGLPAQALSPRDQLLLEAGIPLETRADCTRAIEDFCS